MEVTQDVLLDWLRDAHAMEKMAIDILQRQHDRLESYPDLKNKVREHLEVTKRQASQLETLFERYDEDPSAVKDAMGRIAGNMGPLANMMSGDEVVKNGIASYTFEHFEIASYRALIAAAEQLGEDEVARVCRNILQEEEQMAGWLGQNLPTVTQEFVRREMSGQQNKR
jgi:ferritin-like metal-binding protein YciE